MEVINTVSNIGDPQNYRDYSIRIFGSILVSPCFGNLSFAEGCSRIGGGITKE